MHCSISPSPGTAEHFLTGFFVSVGNRKSDLCMSQALVTVFDLPMRLLSLIMETDFLVFVRIDLKDI